MGQYRKKPIVVEARVVTRRGLRHTADWCNGNAYISDGTIRFHTVEGSAVHADIGDWIIKGIRGEFYPIKDDIFKASYEPVDKPESLGA